MKDVIFNGADGELFSDSRADCAQRLLEAYPGDFKEKPALGIWIAQMIGGTASPYLRGEINRQLDDSGIKVESTSVSESGISIEIE